VPERSAGIPVAGPPDPTVRRSAKKVVERIVKRVEGDLPLPGGNKSRPYTTLIGIQSVSRFPGLLIVPKYFFPKKVFTTELAEVTEKHKKFLSVFPVPPWRTWF
jgi:hypothetical protein